MPKNSNITIGVIYYRVSTAEQVQGFSLENQKEACLKYAQDHGITIVAEFHDDGFSAKTADRKGLQDMLIYCANKKNGVQSVIFNKVDRLSRDVNDYSAIYASLTKAGVVLISTTEAIDNTPFGQFMGNIMSSIAQLDNDVRSERVTDGIHKCLQSGRWPFKAPLGYSNYIDPAGNKKIILDEGKYRSVASIFEDYATGIYTAEDIRLKVNQRGLRTDDGKEITFQYISKILSNNFYIGIMTVKGKEYQGSHTPLIDQPTFYKCQQIRKRIARGDNMAESHAEESFPLRHFTLCAFCGRPLTGAFSRGKSGKLFPYYRCYNKTCPSKKSVAKKKLEDHFIEYLRDITPKEKFLHAFKLVIIDEWQRRYKELNKDSEVAHQKIREIQAEKDKVLELKKREVLSDDDFKIEFEKIKLRMIAQQAVIRDLKCEEFNVDEAVTYCFNFLPTIPEFYSKATYDQKIKLQSLIFPEKPVYAYSGFLNTKLSPFFGTKKDLARAKSSVVRLYNLARTYFIQNG